MCGITGAVGYIDDAYFEAVDHMTTTMKHRGPDASGIWSTKKMNTNGVIFGHRRLSIIDLNQNSNQPFHDQDSGNVLVYNGELYNFKELRKELISAGFSFRTHSDTEVILKSYLHWGENCVKRFRGMFAFAVFNPANRTIFMTRDRLGIKPLYITKIKNTNQSITVLFSSELRSLLAVDQVNNKMDLTGLSSFLWHGFTVEPNTMIKDITRLPPGSSITLSITGDTLNNEKYWSLPCISDKRIDEEDLFASIEESVKMRMVSDVPIGIFLSGGVDSSVVSALAAKSSDKRIQTFNIAFSESDYNESQYAKRVANQLGTEHTEIILSEELFKSQLYSSLDSLDQPTFDALNTFFVSKAVKDAGITVALSGAGGDELFGGYSSFKELPILRNASMLTSFVPKSILSSCSSMIARLHYGKPKYFPHQTRWGKLGECLGAKGNLLKLYQLSYSLFLPDFIHELSNSKCPSNSFFGIPQNQIGMMENLTKGSSSLQSITNLELTSFVGNRLLIDTDMTSMASSLEVRVPLLDHVVIEKLSQINQRDRYYPIRKKKLLQKAIATELDLEIFNRPKAGFELPIDIWCRQTLKEELAELFSDKQACEAIGLNSKIVNNLWLAFNEKTPGLYWSRIWSIFVLLWWTKRYKISL